MPSCWFFAVWTRIVFMKNCSKIGVHLKIPFKNFLYNSNFILQVSEKLRNSHHFQRIFRVEKIRPPRNFLPMSAEFWQNKSVCLEIGAGKGKHAVQFAHQYPEKYLLAIERTQEKFLAMKKRANQVHLPNLKVIHADAIAWITHAVPVASIQKIFILYPNPEPNNPNQRWLNMPFFEFLLSRLQPNGQIILATNIKNYADETEEKAITIWQLPTTRQQVAMRSQRTHFEIKYLARGEICWQLEMIKPQSYRTNFDYYLTE